MTREQEAVERLKRKIDCIEHGALCSDFGNDKEVFQLAIKALEQEPSEDCISRQATLDPYKGLNDNDTISIWLLRKNIEQLPPVTPQPKTGRWVKTPKAVMGEGYMWYCNKCEHQVYQDSSRPYPSEKYCPNCGAKMAESEET